MKSIGIGIGDISPALTCYRIDTSCPVAPTCSGFRYFLVPWTANSSCRDPARCGDNKLFAYRGGAVSRRRLANKKLLTICKTLTWCQAALCFRLLSATAAEGKQRKVFLNFFLFRIAGAAAMSFSTSRKLKGSHCATVTLPEFSNNNLCLFSVHET